MTYRFCHNELVCFHVHMWGENGYCLQKSNFHEYYPGKVSWLWADLFTHPTKKTCRKNEVDLNGQFIVISIFVMVALKTLQNGMSYIVQIK